MSDAMPIIEEGIKRTGVKRKIMGTVVAGTVYGDIQSVGKTMVCAHCSQSGL